MTDDETTGPPFKVGDRVRLTSTYLPHSPQVIRTGEVIEIIKAKACEGLWWVRVKKDRRDGARDKPRTRVVYTSFVLEPETDREILRDHYADLLIAEYKAGNETALRPLIDRLLEVL